MQVMILDNPTKHDILILLKKPLIIDNNDSEQEIGMNEDDPIKDAKA